MIIHLWYPKASLTYLCLGISLRKNILNGCDGGSLIDAYIITGGSYPQ